MADGQYLMGIDFGTGGVRVGLFDPEGTPKVFYGEEFDTDFPRSGWAEQDPDQWWSSFVRAVRGALDKSGVAAGDIAGVATDFTSCTVLAVDEDGRHLRPALLWMDVRASDQARRLAETADPALKYNGYGSVSAEWMPSKSLWLKENERENYDAARYICEGQDWITHKLTGEWVTSINNASIRWYYDRNAGGWPESLYEAVGIGDVLEKFPGPVLDMGTVVGGLRSEVASELGLKEGTPVAVGGVDAFVGALGLGVTEPGKMALITGSSHVMIGQSAEPIYGRGFFGAYTDAQVPGQYTVEGGQVSTGSIVAWFKNRYAMQAAEQAKERGVDPYEILNEMAKDIPIGSDGLIVIDYFQGNRTPYTDPLARGMMWGLSLSHTEAHLFRAIIEGICYGTEHILRTMRGHDFEPRLNVVAGGPTKSDLWMQMHADVSNVPIQKTAVGESPVLGAAMLAAVGAGVYEDVREASENMVHAEDTIEPNAEAHEAYKFYVDRYIDTYPQMRDLMHETVSHVASEGRAPV
ncbi:Ribulose kinase (plasmid) [Rubrobacter radiotolerans]|uniref:FGGY family carbohydrate kinase n=1 Tax=Rubrobacter radiotolerans TaxID=42256 RepID=A0A023X7W2_RUBRA|nr:FGGY family carbohydrate kinase [Rubrobacter radiotolerans]AHY48306.1 Ribulose kinase [Rubrobacter radiotolerans]MDX5895579.1 FGGY family carbohydrate kinase [Rubrobacter radiotolerans]SMC01503.1 ribulokinase [Rubrobacter radiotolerans DSM 5868]